MHRPERLLADVERADPEWLGLGVRALDLVERGEVIEAGRDVRMHRPQRLLADVERADIERLGFGVRALGPVEFAEAIQALCNVGMHRPERLLADVERADPERLGLGVHALGQVERREIMETLRDVGMHRPQRLLADVERADIERLSLAVRALVPVEQGEVMEALRDVEMHRPRRLLGDVERADKKRLGLGVRAFVQVEGPEVVEAFRDVGMHQPERLLTDVERTDKRRLGTFVRALRLVESREVVEADRDLSIARFQHLLAKRQALLRERNCILKLAFGIQSVHGLIEARGFVEHRSPLGHRLCFRAAMPCTADQRNDDCKGSGWSSYSTYPRDLQHPLFSFDCVHRAEASPTRCSGGQLMNAETRAMTPPRRRSRPDRPMRSFRGMWKVWPFRAGARGICRVWFPTVRVARISPEKATSPLALSARAAKRSCWLCGRGGTSPHQTPGASLASSTWMKNGWLLSAKRMSTRIFATVSCVVGPGTAAANRHSSALYYDCAQSLSWKRILSETLPRSE